MSPLRQLHEEQQRNFFQERAEQERFGRQMLLQEHAEGRESEREVQGMKREKARIGKMCSPYDENGSYTGAPEEGGMPVQDADDL